MGLDHISPIDREQLHQLLALHPELGSLLGVAGKEGLLPELTTEARLATLATLCRWRDARAELEQAPREQTQRDFDLDQRIFAASIELARYVEEDLRWWEYDPNLPRGLAALFARDLAEARQHDVAWETLRVRLEELPGCLASAQGAMSAADDLLRAAAIEDCAALGSLVEFIIGEATSAADAGHLTQHVAGSIARSAVGARDALDRRYAWLKGLPTSTERWRIGEEHFNALLHHRALDISVADLADLSASVVEQLRLEERRIANRLFRKREAAGALPLARTQEPHYFEEALSWSEELVAQSRIFLDEAQAFPVANTTSLTVLPAPAGFAPDLDDGMLLEAPRFAPERGSFLLLHAPPQAELGRRSVADLENMVAAHALPGALLFSAVTRERTSLLRSGAPLGLLGGPGSLWALETSAGWRFHAEELMRELLFRDSPASRLVAARRGLYRALLARIELGLHTRGLRLDQAKALLLEVGGASEERASRDLTTCMRSPTRALSELLGRLRLQQLRREAKLYWRDRYADRTLHELVLSGGPMPLTYHFELLDDPPSYTIDDSDEQHAAL
ncbi:MAG: DUF885 family protein [Myxococcota bacterium]